MAAFNVAEFVAKMDRMGLKFTAVPLPDGKFRINRWCMREAFGYKNKIEDLWAAQFGNDQTRIDQLTTYLFCSAPAVNTKDQSWKR